MILLLRCRRVMGHVLELGGLLCLVYVLSPLLNLSNLTTHPPPLKTTTKLLLQKGQKQRISIARALIRSPSLILLDEATSSLDSETEKEVMQVFEGKERGITRIAVAHRLATVQNADVIFVMGEGRVVERGTHGELLRLRGVYWEMCRGQAFDG
jgi:ABC-type transport system involved in cytochrome bd biosynthesis fused ATPase/permease subunit